MPEISPLSDATIDIDDIEDDILPDIAADLAENRFEVSHDQAGQRLDKVLSRLVPDLSRSRLQVLLADNAILLDGKSGVSANFRVKGGEIIDVTMPDIRSDILEPQDIPLDIVYEDDDLLVINKPAGLVVHPGAGNADHTLVNALLFHCGESLSGIGGVKRPGIVHRLDKDTTGLMLVAKNDHAHQHLSEQLQTRTLSRTYWAFTVGKPMPMTGVIDQPIDRHRANRLKMAVLGSGRSARTHFRVLDSYGEKIALVECELETGRTHQIRVHMAHIRCPLIGDPLYGPPPTALNAALGKAGELLPLKDKIKAFPRQALHAKAIRFVHPVTEEEMAFDTPLPDDLQMLADDLDRLLSPA